MIVKRRLKGERMEVKKLSIVSRPATRNSFLVIKSEKGKQMEELLKQLEDFGVDVSALKDKIDPNLEKAEMSEEAQEALIGSLKKLNQFRDEFPDQIKEAISTLAKFAVEYGYGKAYPEPEKSEKGTLPKESLDVIQEVCSELEKAVNSLEALVSSEEEAGSQASESEEEEVTEIPEELSKSLESLSGSVVELNKRIGKIEKARGISKSIPEGEGSSDDEGEGGPKWPSLTGAGETS